MPIELIKVGQNIRDSLVEEEQVTLAHSIEQNRIVVPLLGHYEGTDIVVDDGHRRLDAAIRAGLDAVPMIVAELAPTPAEILTLQLVANCARTGLKTMERVRAIDRLMNETGWPAAMVTSKLGGPSAAMISKLLTLLVLPKSVQDLIDAGRIPMSSAYAIAIVADSVERERLIGEVVNGRLTRDRLVAEIKANRSKKSRSQKSKRESVPRLVLPLGEGRSITVAGPAMTVNLLITWVEELLNRIKSVNAQGVTLTDIVKVISGAQP
ncbi:MAG TPA: ParB/RepB/Spo0J family partition protein [Phycisphaerae bacterium]|nr:ParB/RepB/Spo0J family partition protein [Phycisphaerae bacterium]